MCVVSSGPVRDAGADPDLPTLVDALRPATAEGALVERLHLDDGGSTRPRLRSIRVMAYKPRRRCLIEYGLEIRDSDRTAQTTAILGKIRAGRFGKSGYRQLRAIWDAGFDDRSVDGISVPEPLATVPALRMWLQRRVPGRLATEVLGGPEGPVLAARIAQAVHKLHTTDVPVHRRHSMDDELRILTRCLAEVAATHPELAPRLHRLNDTCGQVGAMVPEPAWCGSHRDFYADQVLVSDSRLFLIDFDLFCQADPALDIGNFLGHVTEQALRVYGSAQALASVERELEERFVALAGERVRWAVRVYAGLTTARHVYLSTRFRERSHLTGSLLTLAEERLQTLAAEGGHA